MKLLRKAKALFHLWKNITLCICSEENGKRYLTIVRITNFRITKGYEVHKRYFEVVQEVDENKNPMGFTVTPMNEG